MRDFTLQIYSRFIKALISTNYNVLTFEEFITSDQDDQKTVVLRHDVDRIPINALKMAKIENELGVKSTYYFRIVSSVWDESIIEKVVSLGHEVAYHYEDLTITNGDFERAISHFEKHLNKLRQFYPSKTICMHGSPISKWDNRKLWEKYDYREYGIIAEPYFDVDYKKVFYITDTGRKWNNETSNIRDKVNSGFDIPVYSTQDLIDLFQENKLPNRVMINTHPHRWFDYGINWYKELYKQSIKNSLKNLIVKFR